MKLAYADRDSYYADPAFVDVPGEGLLSKAYARERAKLIDPQRASRAFIAGNPLAHDSRVKSWRFWVANLADAVQPGAKGPDAEPIRGTFKDTTHIAIIDKDGNVFDSTPSGGWIGGAVILGETGIGMSVRGEQFWLDATRAAQLRPRSRPRYTLTPSIVLRNGQPFMALGTPGGVRRALDVRHGAHAGVLREHLPLVRDVMERMRASGLDDVPVVVGGIIPPADADIPVPGRPDRGHGSNRFGLSAGWREDDFFLEARIRPAYHHLMDADAGLEQAVRAHGMGGQARGAAGDPRARRPRGARHGRDRRDVDQPGSVRDRRGAVVRMGAIRRRVRRQVHPGHAGHRPGPEAGRGRRLHRRGARPGPLLRLAHRRQVRGPVHFAAGHR